MLMDYIDTHCHFNFSPFKESLTQSLATLRNAKVKAAIVPATGAKFFSSILDLSQQFVEIAPALGLHPVWVEQHKTIDLSLLQQLLASCSEVVAIGEIGLDFSTPELVTFSERQSELLLAQFTFARQFNLPVILHSRRSHDVLAKYLRQATLPATGVIHGFTGSYSQAKRFIDLGYYIGVGGSITYPRANKTRQTITQLPLDALVLETDAPDMPLAGFQGQANRPEQVVAVGMMLAELRNESIEQVIQTVWENSLRLFPRLQPVK